jgi:hypothetical protein
MKIENIVYQLTEVIEFEALDEWCDIFGIEYEEPYNSDDWGDWEYDLRGELAEMILRIGH